MYVLKPIVYLLGNWYRKNDSYGFSNVKCILAWRRQSFMVLNSLVAKTVYYLSLYRDSISRNTNRRKSGKSFQGHLGTYWYDLLCIVIDISITVHVYHAIFYTELRKLMRPRRALCLVSRAAIPIKLFHNKTLEDDSIITWLGSVYTSKTRKLFMSNRYGT